MQRYAAGKFVSKSLTTGVSRCRQISRIVGQIVNRIKDEAIRDIRRQVAVLSVDIAEKVLRKNLQDKESQMGMIDRMLDEVLTPNKN